MILKYEGHRTHRKPRELKAKSLSLEEAAVYDLIFNRMPLRPVANRIDMSYQGVYIRALDYVKYWANEGIITFNPSYLKKLNKEQGETMAPPATEEE